MTTNFNTLSRKRKRAAKVLFPLLGLGLLLSFQNCSPGVVTSQKAETAASSGISDEALALDTKPTTLTYSENIIPSIQTLLGISPADLDGAARTARDSARQKSTENGATAALNAPFLTALTNYSGELCRLFVAKEVAQTNIADRRVTSMIDFTKDPSNISEAAKDNVIQGFARLGWSREASVIELATIKTALNEAFIVAPAAGKTPQQQTEAAAIYLCVAVMASIDSVRF